MYHAVDVYDLVHTQRDSGFIDLPANEPEHLIGLLIRQRSNLVSTLQLVKIFINRCQQAFNIAYRDLVAAVILQALCP